MVRRRHHPELRPEQRFARQRRRPTTTLATVGYDLFGRTSSVTYANGTSAASVWRASERSSRSSNWQRSRPAPDGLRW
jgi:hypothetical protein